MTHIQILKKYAKKLEILLKDKILKLNMTRLMAHKANRLLRSKIQILTNL